MTKRSSEEVPLLESLLLIAAHDQLAAALDQLRSQMTGCLDVLALRSEERARVVQAYRDIQATVTSIDELLAFERSEES